MAIPIIGDFLERFFGPPEDSHSRDDVNRRLKVVLAHDRLALDPQTLEMMRQEIIAVVSRYAEIDFDSLEFSLGADQRMTTLTANVPIRRVRPLSRSADEPIPPEAETRKIELASQSKTKAANAKIEQAALQEHDENRSDSMSINKPLDTSQSGLSDSNLSESDQRNLALESDLTSDSESSRLEVEDLALNDSSLDNLETESTLDDLRPSSLELETIDDGLSGENSKPTGSDTAVEPRT